MQILTILTSETDELGHCLNTKAYAPPLIFHGFEIITYDQYDSLFFSPKAVIDPMVIFIIHGVLDEQKYRNLSLFLCLVKRFIIHFKHAFRISCELLEQN